jgi:hypothetical protein
MKLTGNENLRSCIYVKRIRTCNSAGNYEYNRVVIDAQFHCWSSNSDGEGGQYPVGILELEDGCVKIVRAELIKFVD